MKHSFTLLHKTANRVRYRYPLLCECECDTNKLEAHFEALESVKAVRINDKVDSIIFWYKNDTIELERAMRDLNANRFVKGCDFTSESCICAEQKPSFIPISRSLAGLLLSKILPSDASKMAVTTAATFPLMMDGIAALFKRGINSTSLEALAVGISIYQKEYLSANVTNAMIEFGEYIENATVFRSNDLVKELAKPSVETVWVEKVDKGIKTDCEIPFETLQVGDIVLVGTGDIIAVDGTIVEGEGFVNQVSMTGEAEPLKVTKGDKVLSGSIVEEGRIKIWADTVGEDTATARIKHYIESSLFEKSSMQLKSSKMADQLVPMTLGLAAASWLFTGKLQHAASTLQADYSCALKLTTPVAFKSTISKAGKNGILVKGAKAIEALHSSDTFIFDKTGTLTSGKLEVEEIEVFDNRWNANDVLNLAASAEEHYMHPIAEAVVNAAKEKGFVHKHHEEVELIVAHGVKTYVDEKCVVIGSKHFLEEDEQISFKGHTKTINALLKKGYTLLYIGYDHKLLATICLKDTLRSNTKKAIQRLRSAGVKSIGMLTGDVQSKAEEIAAEVGLDMVYPNLLPTEKSEIIKKLMDEGKKVAFVGDGINDAPALASAHVGISMFTGADIAKATADVGLLKDDIEAVCEIKEMADKTMELVNENFNTAVGVNTTILALASFGVLSTITASVLHNGTTIGLLMRALSGVRVPGTHLKKAAFQSSSGS